MSHAFPNLQAHPTLTPNPTFQPQPLPLPLTTMTQQSQSQPQPPNTNNHNISPLPPTHTPHHPPHPHPHTRHNINAPMQFIPPPHHYHPHPHPHPHPHTHTHLLPLHTLNTLNTTNHSHTPDYNPITNTTHTHTHTHPPPLTHENDIVSQDLNDINTSTSNDESGGIDSTISTSTNSNPNKTLIPSLPCNTGEKTITITNTTGTDADGDEDIDLNDENPNNNRRTTHNTHNTHNTHGPFGGIYGDTLSNISINPHALHSHTHTPFGINGINGINGVNTHDMDRKVNKLSYFMPSPFMPPPPTQHTVYNDHPSEVKDPATNGQVTNGGHGVGPGPGLGWQFALLPQQIPNINPMFGHHPAYLPNDAYLRRPNYGEQGMVDVPHVTAAQLSEDMDTITNKNPSISMLLASSNTNNNNNNISSTHSTHLNQPALNIQHGLNTNNHINSSTNSHSHSPSKSDSNRVSSSSNNHKKDGHHKKKRKHRKHKEHKRDRKVKKKHNHRSNKEDTKTKYVSIRGNDNEQSVKGGAGNGYRMVLDEPVNKNMLSCHQCKNKKTLDRIIVCGHVYRINNTVKTCTKKYCKSCLLRFYLEAPPTDNQDPAWSAWKCPCCRYICCCAWCRKKKAKRLESVSNAIRAEAHRLTPAISLARKLVSESRVNNNNNHNSNQSQTKHKKRMNRNHNSIDIPPQI